MNTFENFKTLSREYTGGHDDISLVKNFKNIKEQTNIIAYIFCNNYKLFTSKVSKFDFLISEDDRDSSILEGIVNGLQNFDISRGTKLIPYITNCVYNSVRTEAQRVKKGDYEYLIKSERFEQEVDKKDNSMSLDEVDSEIAIACSTTDTYEYELVSLIESLNLTDKQKEYLSLIVSHPSLKSVDIAKILGVGRSAIAMYNKRIREKMVSFGLAI